MYRESELNPLIILLRHDISDPGLATAQACHAAYEYGRKYPAVPTNNYLYVLRAEANDLIFWESRLKFRGVPYVLFREPDLDNMATALCCSINPNKLSGLDKF